MAIKYILLLILASPLMLSFIGCQKDDPEIQGSLKTYIDDNGQWTPFNELVACAAGGQQGFLDDPSAPLSMFFYPKLYSTNFKYYEARGTDIDTGDLSLFTEKQVSIEPLFNGFMARFPLPAPDEDHWARVSFVSNDTLWYCKPVRLKINEKPTLFQPELVDVNFDSNAQPTFSWNAEADVSNIIYFQIIADERGDAISATYTTDKTFTYYDLANVVFNVTRPGPVLPLQKDREYSIILMGISSDNWVNTLSERSFITQ